MLINNSGLKAFAYCILLLTIVVANTTSSKSATEGHVENQSTEEVEDWRQPMPTTKRAMALLNKLVMVAHRANTKKHQKAQSLLTKQTSHLSGSNQIAQHYQDLNYPRTSSTESNEDEHYGQPKSIVLPHRMGLERRDQKTSRIFWRCYFNAVTCFR